MVQRSLTLTVLALAVIGVVVIATFTLVRPGTSPESSLTTQLSSSSTSPFRSTSSSTRSSTSTVNTSSTSSQTTVTSDTSTFNGTWFNLRGVAYPWEPLIYHPDQRGSPDPEWSFQQFRMLGFNFIRMDGLSWGSYQNNPTAFMSNLARVMNAANQNGIYVSWGFATIPGAMPTDVVGNFMNSTQWNNYWWNDQTYNGNQTNLQGLGIWQAWFKGFIQPVVSVVDSQQCTMLYSVSNEPKGFPSSNSTSYLSKYYATMGTLFRQTGATKYLVYSGPGSLSGASSLINQINPLMNGGYNFRPAIYSTDYVGRNPSTYASDAQFVTTNNLGLWDTEEATSFYTQSNLQIDKQYNAMNTLFRWDEDGNLLASNGGTITPTGTLTSAVISIANLETQVLGPAQFFTG